MNYKINKIAVLGSGLMGSGIACHLSGAGFEVLLLDLASEGSDKNALVNAALKKSLAGKPSPIYHTDFVSRIKTGNFDEDLSKVRECDWIIEVIVEKLEIKKSLYEKLEAFLKPGTVITSNTSGIPIHFLIEGRSQDFREHFCGTHFFNPPRYLKLLEIIPTVDTKKELVEFLMQFGKEFLGKQTVLCKDTPAFIANRIGVVSMSKVFELTEELGLSISEADKLTGPTLGRPKSGTFRLTDLVGLDTAAMVTAGLKKNCPDDIQVQKLRNLKSIDFLLKNNWFGNKSGKGFYVKSESKDEKGKPVFLSLDLNTLEYSQEKKSTLESLSISKQIDDLPRRLKTLIKLNDAGAMLIQKSLGFLFAYSSRCIPEITDSIYSIDFAMKHGYAWELGPFEYWDAIGFEEGLRLIEECGESPAEWVIQMKELQSSSGHNSSFYKNENKQILFYNLETKAYQLIPGQQKEIRFSLFDKNTTIFQNEEVLLHEMAFYV
jgi:3-hydroxyacyl-CoA dehydrogenase